MNVNAVPPSLERQLDALNEINMRLKKPMLIQHFEVNEKGGCKQDKKGRCVTKEHQQEGYHTWHPWATCKHEGWPIFHRNVLITEVLFECDDPPANTPEGWATQRVEYNKIVRALKEHGIKYQLFYGGNKSIHLHVLFEPETAFLQDTVDAVDPDEVDMFKVARLTILRQLTRIVGSGISFDESSLNSRFSTDGDMVRVEGSSRIGRGPKTYLGDEVPETPPAGDTWVPALDLPEPSDFSFLNVEIAEAVTAEIEAARKRAEAGPITDEDIALFRESGMDWKQAVPMWRNWFVDGAIWNEGKRNERGTMCIRAMVQLGLDQKEIDAELEKLKVHVQGDYDFERSWFGNVGRMLRERKDVEIDLTVALETIRGKARMEAMRKVSPTTIKEFNLVLTSDGSAPAIDLEHLKSMSYDEIRDIFKRHIYFENEVTYDEVLLIVNQTRLKEILPPEVLANLAFIGDYSAAKTYSTRLAVFLADGQMLEDLTEAYLYNLTDTHRGITVGIDELDSLITKYPHVEATVRYGNRWNATRGKMDAKGRSHEGKEQNIGGPKFFNAQEELDAALMSRALKTKMVRHTSGEMIREKALGFPNMWPIRLWLQMKCEEALKSWDREKVITLMRSKEFTTEFNTILERIKIPRAGEIIQIVLVIGHVLKDVGFPINNILDHYLGGTEHSTEQMAIYKGITMKVHDQIVKILTEKKAREPILKNAVGAELRLLVNVDRDDVDLKSGDLVIKPEALYAAFAKRLRDTSGEVMKASQWYNVLSQLGFAKGRNWEKFTKRGTSLRNKWVLVFDAPTRKRLNGEEPEVVSHSRKEARNPPPPQKVAPAAPLAPSTSPSVPAPASPLSLLYKEKDTNVGAVEPVVAPAVEPVEPMAPLSESTRPASGEIVPTPKVVAPVPPVVIHRAEYAIGTPVNSTTVACACGWSEIVKWAGPKTPIHVGQEHAAQVSK
jgi:hypothetical protein